MVDAVSTDAIRGMRAFNRTVTERIGALDDQYLSRGRPLGASRLLWEISAQGSDLRQLRNQLGLDSGYLSRLLRGLEQDGLVTVGPLESDRRVRIARRTPAGDAEVGELDRLSDEGVTASDAVRRGLHLVAHEKWLDQARTDAKALADENLSDEPDAW